MSDNTRDLSKFGFREYDIASKLLHALANPSKETQANPNEFYLSDGVVLEFNPSSGYVFLVDEDYNVAMLNDEGKLENFLTCSNCGFEAFQSKVKILDDEKAGQCHIELL